MDQNRLKSCLLVLSVLGSGLGFLTQTLVSGFWSATFSQDVYHLSINIAFYFLFMGIGSVLAARWTRPHLFHLVALSLFLSAWAGLSIPVLKLAILKFNKIAFLPIFIVSIAGLNAGLVLPMTLRVAEDRTDIRLSTLLFLDYGAALLFTLAFTFWGLPHFGYSNTSVLSGLIGFIICTTILLSQRIRPQRWVALALTWNLLPIPLHYLTKQTQEKSPPPSNMKVVFEKQSPYQKVVLVKMQLPNSLFPMADQHILYLDGFLQFSSADEQLYHACIVNVPLAAASFAGHPVSRALILGGGDGLAARNLLANTSIKKVTLVEIDPVVLNLAKYHPKLREFNLGSLSSPRIEVIVGDAFDWVRRTDEKFDLVLIDFPAPKNLALARLFSAEFYRNVLNRLTAGGFLATQSGPAFAPEDESNQTLSKIATSVRRTVASLNAPAFTYVTPRDNDSFVLATALPNFKMDQFADKIGMSPNGSLSSVCLYNRDWKTTEAEINTLNSLKLTQYSMEWYKTVGWPYFFYQGAMGVFLPN